MILDFQIKGVPVKDFPPEDFLEGGCSKFAITAAAKDPAVFSLELKSADVKHQMDNDPTWAEFWVKDSGGPVDPKQFYYETDVKEWVKEVFQEIKKAFLSIHLEKL